MPFTLDNIMSKIVAKSMFEQSKFMPVDLSQHQSKNKSKNYRIMKKCFLNMFKEEGVTFEVYLCTSDGSTVNMSQFEDVVMKYADCMSVNTITEDASVFIFRYTRSIPKQATAHSMWGVAEGMDRIVDEKLMYDAASAYCDMVFEFVELNVNISLRLLSVEIFDQNYTY